MCGATAEATINDEDVGVDKDIKEETNNGVVDNNIEVTYVEKV